MKVLKVKPVYQQMTISPKLGVLEISTLWLFRLPLLIQIFIKVASSPRLSGIGMPSPILWSHQRIVLLSSLLWWELGTNSLITGPGEWLSFRRFTSKLSWSWLQDRAHQSFVSESELSLVTHQNDNHSPRPWPGRLVPSSRQRSEFSNTILGTFSRGDKRVWKCILVPNGKLLLLPPGGSFVSGIQGSC